MKKISTTISYHKDKENLLQVVVGITVCQNGKIHSTELKLVFNQIPELFFFRFPKSPSS